MPFRFDLIKTPMKPGQIVTFDVLGAPCQISNIITSWAAPAFRLEANGSYTRLA